MSWYIDTSAAIKLLIEEQESSALRSELQVSQPQLVSCLLLETEIRRSATRIGISQQSVTDLLEFIELSELPNTFYRQAGLIPPTYLRTLDAMHLTAALNMDVAGMYVYDKRLSDAVSLAGLRVRAPVSVAGLPPLA